MCRDEQLYESPNVFDPSRFFSRIDSMAKKEPILSDDDPRGIVFGFGRRCVSTNVRSKATRIIGLKGYALASTLLTLSPGSPSLVR